MLAIYSMVFWKRPVFLVWIYNQQFWWTIILMVFDFEGYYIWYPKHQCFNDKGFRK